MTDGRTTDRLWYEINMNEKAGIINVDEAAKMADIIVISANCVFQSTGTLWLIKVLVANQYQELRAVSGVATSQKLSEK